MANMAGTVTITAIWRNWSSSWRMPDYSRDLRICVLRGKLCGTCPGRAVRVHATTFPWLNLLQL
jgi:hypothetical protein